MHRVMIPDQLPKEVACRTLTTVAITERCVLLIKRLTSGSFSGIGIRSAPALLPPLPQGATGE
jgi:hypothetical protein